MRVTSSLMSKSYLRNLNRQTSKVLKYQNQLSSLKEVSKPSDDPLTVSKILDLNNSITQNENYLTTIDEAIDWTNVQDSALDQASNALGRIRVLIQTAANGTLTPEDRQAVKKDVEGEIASFEDALNTSFGGRYVFAGDHTTTKPFDYSVPKAIGALNYNGSEVELSREVAPGVSVQLQTNGNDLHDISDLTIDGINDMQTFFDEVLTALDGTGVDGAEPLGGKLLEGIDLISEKVVGIRSNVGATFNRLESAKSRNESERINLKSVLSSKEDVDLAEKYMEYSMEMVAYEASLQMGTRILQTNILNYL